MHDCGLNRLYGYIRRRYSNGPTKGLSNKMKLIQRIAYGLRNEHNRRAYELGVEGLRGSLNDVEEPFFKAFPRAPIGRYRKPRQF